MREWRRESQLGFNRSAVIALSGLLGIVSMAWLYFAVQGRDTQAGAERATTSVSASALGFKGLADLLRDFGFTVARNRLAAPPGGLNGSVAVIASPRSVDEFKSAIQRFEDAHAILLVAPKHLETRAPQPNRFVLEQELLDEDLASRLVGSAASGLRIARPASAPDHAVSLIGPAPRGRPSQVLEMTDADLRIVVGSEGRGGDPTTALLVELQASAPRIWLLADAEPLNNRGLFHQDNAVFAIRLFDALAHSDRKVVFDEAMNGDIVAPTALANLFSLPWLALTAALLGLIAVIGLTGAYRFGDPKEGAVGIAAGRMALLDAAARLHLARDGGAGASRIFLRRTMQVVARRRRAPRLAEDDLAAWFRPIEARLSTTDSASRLLADARAVASDTSSSTGRSHSLARRIHRWRLEMLDGH